MRTPSAAYARVDLDARIEASSGGDLTRICLEEAVAALGQALIALRRKPATFPRDALTRAHGIAVHLARSVAPDSPMHDALVQFYGGLAASLARNMAEPRLEEIAQARVDFQDLLSVAGECRRSV
ncbi:MAG: hypothetical protein QNI87_11415 [Erythrobacter sp.]|uniref:hypothetical protein n=1 Tax=Erythrobacter sp. TaxID=1042 RepID=UPI0026261FA1|nr:hypothetical protein [Erythrobacter sp.]MDJ0979126.1 hypothetical protein [Erythrobacter sp.]